VTRAMRQFSSVCRPQIMIDESQRLIMLNVNEYRKETYL